MNISECNNFEEIIRFIDNDELSYHHTSYYHYTSLKNVNCILEDKAFRMTLLSKTTNDISEKEKYEKLDKKLFSLCFSTGTSESLPLWYLYSGIDGQGARIGFKKKDFISLINNAQFSLLETESLYPYEAIGDPIPLEKNDYKVYLRDILYIGKDPINDKVYRIKYNGCVVNDINKEDYMSIDKEYYRFIKGLIWFYEKETRLQIKITNGSLLDADKNYVVLIDISDVFSKLDIRLAPEFETEHELIIKSCTGIKNWLCSKLQKSDYAGQLKMNLSSKLCRECKYNQGADNK